MINTKTCHKKKLFKSTDEKSITVYFYTYNLLFLMGKRYPHLTCYRLHLTTKNYKIKNKMLVRMPGFHGREEREAYLLSAFLTSSYTAGR